MDIYQVCSNNTPGAKKDPPRGSHILHRLISKGKHEKILSETIGPCYCQHAHSYFCLGVHVPPGVSIWGYMFIFEGTHILELFFHSKRIEAMKSDHLDVYNSDIIML